MGAAFIIALREGIEASLIVSILLAYLRRVDRRDRSPLVWAGTAAALVASAAAGTAIFLAGTAFEGTAEAVFAGSATLVAVAVLTGMVFWMRREAGRIRGELQAKVDSALLAGGWALAALAFFAVLREGIETALFLFAAAKGTAVGEGTVASQLGGAAAGLLLATALGILAFQGGIRLDLRTFFRVTAVALIVIGGGLLAYGVHEFQGIGWLPFLDATAFDISAVLPDGSGMGAILRGLVGYNADPTILEVLVWGAYLAVVGVAYRAPLPRAVGEPATTR